MFRRVLFAVAMMALPVMAEDPKPPVDELPVAAITVVDSHGMAITDEVGYGQQIVVSAEKAIRGKGPNSLVWRVKPQFQTFTSPDKSLMVITTGQTDGVLTLLQMVALGDSVAFQEITIKIGNGAQPPPDPRPDPKPDPRPDPKPTVKRVFIAVVGNSLQTPAENLTVMNAIAVWNSIKADGSDWQHIDLKDNGTPRTRQVVADALKSNIPPPVFLQYELKDSGELGALLEAAPVQKDVASLRKDIAKFKGVAK